MTTTHTPGPWAINGREVVGPADSGVIVARLPEWGILADGLDPAPANGRLIVAAPELLHSAVAIVNTIVGQAPVITDSGMMQVWISIEELNLLRAAISKATEA